MATFDQLSAEQRAIIELVLKQGQSYAQLGELLGMPEARVRKLARSALLTLSPVSGGQVDEDWRGQIADYLLGQQSGPESAATRAHLRRSETGRAWARSLLDSLDQFYDPAAVPTIPAGSAGAAPRAPKKAPRPEAADASEEDATADAALAAEARAIVMRRRVAGVAAFVVAGLLALLLWPIGVLTSDGDDDKADAREEGQGSRVIGQLVLRPQKGAEGAGLAAIAERGRERSLIVQARLTPNKNREAYEVWLYNSNRNARSLGAQVTDRQGIFQGTRELPRDFARFNFIDVSRERVDESGGHSGQSVLRGRIDDFAAPVPQQQPQQQR